MSLPQFINDSVIPAANYLLDVVFLWGMLILFIAYPIYFFISNFKKYAEERKSVSLIIETLILVLVCSLAAGVWAFPEGIWYLLRILPIFQNLKIPEWKELAWILSSVRWIEAFIAFWIIARTAGREHGGTRWSRSALIQIAIICLGWPFNRWIGMLFISIPLLVAYYASLRDLSHVILPASDPEDRAEQKKRAMAFISYTWGIQSPMIVADGHSWKQYKPRINGDFTWDFSDFPFPFINQLKWRPGVIWMRSHQVAAISGGMKFKRMDGPGVVFTGKLERLEQIFDLRLQIRSNEIEAVSKDGVHFLTRYFVAFRLDNEEWSRELYDTLRPLNALLRGANKLNHMQGSFHYSSARAQAALSTTSTKATDGAPLIYWDQWVMSVVEDQTRRAISQKKLDEMWRPSDDQKFANALDVIAKDIRNSTEMILRASGILLVVARVVNFRFDQIHTDKVDDEISKQQIATWGSEWERKRRKILAEAEAEAERSRLEARANAESMLLDAINEGLQKTNEIDTDLPRYVITLRFLSVFQDYLHNQRMEGKGGEESEEIQEKMAELRKVFKTWQEMFFPSEK